MVSRTGGGGPPLPGVQGPQTARRERQAGSSSPQKQSLLSRETHKADGYAQGVCLGLCCAIGSTSHMWLFKTIKIKDDEKFSSLVPWAHLPGSVATRGQWLPNQTAKTQSAPTVAESSAGLRGSRRGCASGSEHESLTER